ncbi:molybdenum cofactor guanylyltransferase MobA [Staphylococcus intermedius]|uniref:Probable molybdenum cofactor guanylyltransferase n=1 Tax=Staphylococcus intermedius NCTC 11048 TaxID=1141106 RepID=A0A380G7N9_STAIN|nr:molybdenum cofactor guanylyltransferase MobA [Staphylococcus intermedius]PCF63711.1 molybdenum cofactor guanylyltransferase [Staphylococcus intermedius]PCF78426.1 molybdenum cofactor guanylyltransferase [Staphylococcus intermedius]PCF79400.1 molybdenum cofactor guanylyltransferase [Staphylococcus intermedius]PCF86864.1 molybdenum cofactor guanylyltransferase [Staphylococcus intermedius]PNZ50658.1 molybdenum cofactor guanylyltransferase MobA [Staphylococcus intermedius NCTC 11048]
MKAIILAGGHSERFGAPKAFAKINGTTFYHQLVQTLHATNMFNEIMISTNEQLSSQFQHDTVVIDEPKHRDKGPLAGIYSAMSRDTDEDLYFVISVDTPMVTQKAISHLYQFMVANLIEEHLDIAGFMDKARPIPTIAFYHKRVLPIIEEVLASDDLSMKHVYEQVSTDWLDANTIDSPHYWYQNVNYQQDLAALEAELAK